MNTSERGQCVGHPNRSMTIPDSVVSHEEDALHERSSCPSVSGTDRRALRGVSEATTWKWSSIQWKTITGTFTPVLSLREETQPNSNTFSQVAQQRPSFLDTDALVFEQHLFTTATQAREGRTHHLWRKPENTQWAHTWVSCSTGGNRWTHQQGAKRENW